MLRRSRSSQLYIRHAQVIIGSDLRDPTRVFRLNSLDISNGPRAQTYEFREDFVFIFLNSCKCVQSDLFLTSCVLLDRHFARRVDLFSTQASFCSRRGAQGDSCSIVFRWEQCKHSTKLIRGAQLQRRDSQHFICQRFKTQNFVA